mgnify:CR=1 FL=1
MWYNEISKYFFNLLEIILEKLNKRKIIMNVMISKKLKTIYKEQHKNYDYAITSILDNFDPECYLTCFGLINEFELDGEKCDICIGDKVGKKISEDLNIDIVDDRTIELLLWIGALFPEV